MERFYKENKAVIINIFLVILLSTFSSFLVFVRWLRVDKPAYLFLGWNLILAWIPLGISVIMYFIASKKLTIIRGVVLGLLGSVWLLFYPNAPYLLTDYIHYQAGNSLMNWYDLILLSSFILTGLVMGFVSLFLVHSIVAKILNTFIGWCFVVFVSFISSYGIYMGRFVRHNSWDLVLDPLYLLSNFYKNINFSSIVFSLVFGSLLTLFYLMLFGVTLLSHKSLQKAE